MRFVVVFTIELWKTHLLLIPLSGRDFRIQMRHRDSVVDTFHLNLISYHSLIQCFHDFSIFPKRARERLSHLVGCAIITVITVYSLRFSY